MCAVFDKEERDAATVYLQGFLMKTEADKDEETIIIKLTGAVDLLLVEKDER